VTSTQIEDDRGYIQGFHWTQTQEFRMTRRARSIIGALTPAQRERVLEVGCGTGELTDILARCGAASITGVDRCAPFIESARAKFGSDRVSYECANLAIPQERERFAHGWTAVVGNGLLHHVVDYFDETLAWMRSILAPQGRFVFWEPNIYNPYEFAIFRIPAMRTWAKLEPDEMAFTPAWVTERLRKAGFRDVTVAWRDFLLPNLPWAVAPAVARVSDVLERVPVVRRLSQSIFIVATNP
jgi:SAM-dependent methyltransferase